MILPEESHIPANFLYWVQLILRNQSGDVMRPLVIVWSGLGSLPE